jgi:hypothetical protein
MATAVISHWGAELQSEVEWLLEEPFLSVLGRAMADAFARIERWDLRVNKAVLELQPPLDNDRQISVIVRAYADLKNAQPRSKDADTSSEELVNITNLGVWMCPECNMPQIRSRLHPEDGCPYGTIDHVMSS